MPDSIKDPLQRRFFALHLLDADADFQKEMLKFYKIKDQQPLQKEVIKSKEWLQKEGIHSEAVKDYIVTGLVKKSEEIYKACVTLHNPCYNSTDRKIDKILTSKAFGIPIMLLLLGIIFWITIAGANYPSELLSSFFGFLEEQLRVFMEFINAPVWLIHMLLDGIFRTGAWVVSVMLPPMAIFFPLFTLLEDVGYLPRVAFNMDKFFKKANAHGKQALSMSVVARSIA